MYQISMLRNKYLLLTWSLQKQQKTIFSTFLGKLCGLLCACRDPAALNNPAGGAMGSW